MVGQNLQNEAADARAANTFEDVEDARDSVQRPSTSWIATGRAD
jgi:hypothetical protein